MATLLSAEDFDAVVLVCVAEAYQVTRRRWCAAEFGGAVASYPMVLGDCGGLELIEDVAVVLRVATQLRDVDGVCVVQLFGELWLLLVSQ